MNTSEKYAFIKLNQQIVNTAFACKDIQEAAKKASASANRFKQAWDKVFPQN